MKATNAQWFLGAGMLAVMNLHVQNKYIRATLRGKILIP